MRVRLDSPPQRTSCWRIPWESSAVTARIWRTTRSGPSSASRSPPSRHDALPRRRQDPHARRHRQSERRPRRRGREAPGDRSAGEVRRPGRSRMARDCTFKSLQRKLQDPFHILHFVGHSAFTRRRRFDPPAVRRERTDEGSASRRDRPTDRSSELAGSCVVFNSCDGSADEARRSFRKHRDDVGAAGQRAP